MAKVITTELQHSGASGANITLDSSKNVTVENNLTVDGTTTLTGAVELPDDTVDIADLSASGTASSSTYLRGDNTWAAISSSDTLSFRNKIVNGSMIINQRGDSTGKTSTGFYGPDRFQTKMEGSVGTWSIGWDSGPQDKGFRKSMLWHCTSGATLSGTNEIYTRYRIEGRDLQDTKWGTSAAEDLILSFWVKSTETGTAIIQVYHNDHSTSDAHTGYAYTINSANTWEKKTIQLVKSTSDAFGFDNGVGMTLQFYFDGGSDMKSGSLNTSYAGHNNANIMPGQTIALAGTGKKLWLTGVQLEIGTTATEFEHRSYQDELQRCKRYCTIYSGNSAGEPSGLHGYLESTSYVIYPIIFDPPLRAGPSFDQNSASVKHYSYDNSGSLNTGLSMPLYNANPVDNSCTAANLKFTVSGLGDSGTTGQLYFMGAGKFFFTSEL